MLINNHGWRLVSRIGPKHHMQARSYYYYCLFVCLFVCLPVCLSVLPSGE